MSEPQLTTLPGYLAGMRAATTAADLETAIQAPFKHSYRGRTWSTIRKVRIEVGLRIVLAHPHAFYIPHFEVNRVLRCCGERYKVGRGQNTADVRYVWHYAETWAQARLREHGLGVRAAHRIWDSAWNDYPHRCLALAEAILAGKVPDPDLNVPIRHQSDGGSPVRYSVEQNDADDGDRRATYPCDCGGTRFDWGGGYSEGFAFVNWHCNGCPDVFTEYMTHERFHNLRRRVAARS